MKRTLIAILAIIALAISVAAQAETITLLTPSSGDATYFWNTKYGPYGYDSGGDTMGVDLMMSLPYGNDYAVSIFEVPIAQLYGKDVISAVLVVDATGFGTNYYYGSASIGWLDTGSAVLTGDVVADGLGPAATALPGGMAIYNSSEPFVDGLKEYDVKSYVLADIAAGRSFSTFVMSGSRDTYGSIYAAESERGPRIIVEAVPEPTGLTALAAGLAPLMFILRRRK